ncbi:MAG: N-acetylmuramoyl-L-alanine amidase, partial [Alphaproteobacteria bacterium]|nr:N-acetylmuramoyl-L-alanine amidase [Alphaproteobacteria bacterium]
MQLVEHPSPNHDARPEGAAPDLVLLHYTGMASGEAALARLCDPHARVSAHYLIEEDGRLFRLVPEERRAWHAGVSCWAGARDINARSIGIELVNPGHEHGYRRFPEAQMGALLALLDDLCRRLPIDRRRVLGHSDVAPERKEDPGELFDWARLAAAGFGLWPSADFAPSPHAPDLAPGMSGAAVLDLQIALAAIGYDLEGTGLFDARTECVVRAFQRHFRPARFDGLADAETM